MRAAGPRLIDSGYAALHNLSKCFRERGLAAIPVESGRRDQRFAAAGCSTPATSDAWGEPTGVDLETKASNWSG